MARAAAAQLVLFTLVAAMVLTATDAAISCGQVSSALSPCISYARGSGSSPPAACCSGVRSLAGQRGAPLTSKRRASALRVLLVGSTLERPLASPPSAASASPTPLAHPWTALRFADQPLATMVAAYSAIHRH
uniref:Putative lipid transfer protein n=1 Tax=Triticum aestivum TaxID=4565 RepID=A0MAU6_WHEAT|nr:putative lipid transfer protein [Triticum aestivum]